jgi:hypothetical protein
MLEELLQPYSKESDTVIHDKMLSLIDRFDADPSTYEPVMTRAIMLYDREFKETPMHNIVRTYYELARDL